MGLEIDLLVRLINKSLDIQPSNSRCQASYSDVILRYAGWPLNLHDRVIIHLAPIDPRSLSCADFYLRVVPARDRQVRIVVQSLDEKGQHELQETPIPETLYRRIFTQDWLRELNVDRHGESLSRCVLATEQSLVKVPWVRVAEPEFVALQRMDSIDQEETRNHHHHHHPGQQGYSVETRICPAKDGIAVSLCLVDTTTKASMDRMLRPVGWVSASTWDSRSESSHVLGEEKDPGMTSETWGRSSKSQKPHRIAPDGPASPDRPTCVRTVRFAEQPCTPCLRRKHGHGQGSQECRYKESCRANQSSCEELDVPPDKTPQTLHRSNRKPSSQAREKETSQGEETITCLAPTVLGTSEKCHIVSQDLPGTPSEGSSMESSMEMIPRLHVVRGRKTTTFGLVSPKLNRRRTPGTKVSFRNSVTSRLDYLVVIGQHKTGGQ